MWKQIAIILSKISVLGLLVSCHESGHFDDHSDLMLDESTRCGCDSPSLGEKIAILNDLEKYKKEIGEERFLADKQKVITVKVHFHVFVHSEGIGEVTDEQIEEQMRVLNDAFKGIKERKSCVCGLRLSNMDEETIHTPFRFVLEEINRIDNDHAFYLETDTSIKLQEDFRVGTCSDLHVFVGSMRFLGSSSLAHNCPTYEIKDDRIRIHHRVLPNGGYTEYDEGMTLVHEVGHWLGLLHTFDGGCNNEGGGDGVSDTPHEAGPAFGCNVGRNTCPSNGDDPVHNFMDYSLDCCVYLFTNGQNDRMILHARVYRDLLPGNEPLRESISPFKSLLTPISSTVKSFINRVDDCMFCKRIVMLIDDGTENRLRGNP